jgi:hypothetical protein
LDQGKVNVKGIADRYGSNRRRGRRARFKALFGQLSSGLEELETILSRGPFPATGIRANA